MKRITASLDDETHRLAKAKAAEKGTSVSAMVRDYLTSLTEAGPEADYPAATGTEKSEKTLSEVIAAIRARGGGLHSADNLTRDELHDRNAFR